MFPYMPGLQPISIYFSLLPIEENFMYIFIISQVMIVVFVFDTFRHVLYELKLQ